MFNKPELPPVMQDDEYPDISGDIAQAIDLRASYVAVWNRCLDFVKGNQNPGLAGTNVAGNKTKRSGQAITINKLLPLYRNITSRLAVAYPSMAVMPASTSPDDLVKSRASEQALIYYWQADRLKEKFAKAVNWLVPTGNVGLLEYYDASKDAVCLEVVKPHDIVFEPGSEDPEASEWVCIQRYCSLSELRKRYPEHEEMITKLNPSVSPSKMTGVMPRAANRVEYRDVYWRDGRRAVMIENEYLWTGRTPEDQFPFQLIRYTHVPGFLWGVGLFEPVLDLQILYNETRLQIQRNIKLVSNPKILYWEGSLTNPGSFTSEPGEKVSLKIGENGVPAPAPQPWAVPSMPAYALDEPARLEAELQDTSGVHAVSLGKRVVGAQSGKAINALTQNDVSQLQCTQEAIEAAVVDMAKNILVLMKAYYPESKMIRMMDRQGSVVFRELQATDLVDTPEVFLEAGTLFRREAADREQRILDHLAAGLLTQEEAKRAIQLRLEPFDLVEQMESMRHAEELLEAVVTLGAPLDIPPGDDTEFLRKVFAKFMRTSAFYELTPERQDDVAAAYDVIIGNPKKAAQPLQAPVETLPAPDGSEAMQGFTDANQGAQETFQAAQDNAGAMSEMAAAGSQLLPDGVV